MPFPAQRVVEALGGLQVMLISVLFHLMIILIMTISIFRYAVAEPPDFNAGEGGFVEAAPISQRAVEVPAAVSFPMEQKFLLPAPPQAAALPVISTPLADAAFSMPVAVVSGPSSDTVAEMEKAMRGATRGAGPASSVGGRIGSGSGRGSGGGFGSSHADDSKLIGIMYDLKQTPSGKPTSKIAYYQVIADFIESRFNPEIVRGYFRSSPLYTSHVFLPVMDAELGPEAFGLERKVAPSNWFIHYQGAFTPPNTGRFRFRAMADDTLVAVVDGRVVIDVSLDRANPGMWEAKTKSFRSGYEFTTGDWMELEAEKSYRLDLIVGERPGGEFKAYLLVEREGEEDASGNPVPRLFSVAPLPDLPDNPDGIAVAPVPLVMTPRRSLRFLRNTGSF